MKRDILDKISSLASVSSVFIALSAVIADLTLVTKMDSSLFKFMLGATAAAAVAALAKIKVERKKPKKDRGRIFLIYAKEDKNRIEDLYEKLKGFGFKPWLDTKEILPGQDWRGSIKKAIEESDLALACISKNSVNKKGFVQAELKMALDILEERTKGFSPVIPVRLEDTEVPERLNKLQWVDLFKKDSIDKLRLAIEKTTTV